MSRWAGAALGLGGLGSVALGAGAAGLLPGAQQQLRELEQQGLQPSAEQVQAAEEERNAMAWALLANLTGTAAAGSQVDWNAGLQGLWPLPAEAAAPTGRRMAGEQPWLPGPGRASATSEAERLAAADVLAELPTPSAEFARQDPVGYRQKLVGAVEQLRDVARHQKYSDEQFEGVRSYVQQAVDSVPPEVLARAAALAVLPSPAGLGEDQRETELLYRVPSVDVRAQADQFVASLPPAGQMRQRMAGFDVMQSWLNGPDYELAGRLLQPHVLGKAGKGLGDLDALRHVLAYDRTANNRINHGWASAAMGALQNGGPESVENYFRRLGQQHGQDLSDWSLPAELKAALPPQRPADYGIDWDVVNRPRRSW